MIFVFFLYLIIVDGKNYDIDKFKADLMVIDGYSNLLTTKPRKFHNTGASLSPRPGFQL